jgi:hypothetical protein
MHRRQASRVPAVLVCVCVCVCVCVRIAEYWGTPSLDQSSFWELENDLVG